MNFIAYLLFSLFIVASVPDLDAQTLSEPTKPNASSEELQQLKIPFTPAAFIEYVKKGNEHVVKLFLASGMNPELEGAYRGSALESAISHPDIVRLLVENGAKVNIIWSSGSTALTLAAERGYVESSKILLENGADTTMKNQYGQTALNSALASAYSNDETIKLLIESGSNVNALSVNGDSPLIKAIWRGRNDLVKLLLEKGADVNVRDHYGRTPLIIVSGPLYCYRKMSDEAESIRNIQTLLDYQADVNAKDGSAQTALMRSSSYGRIQVVKTLLKHGSMMDLKDIKGETALMQSSGAGHYEIVKLLLENGADPNTRNLDGVTPIFFAEGPQRLNIIKEFIAKGANLNLKNDDGLTYLAWSELTGNSHSVQSLKQKSGRTNQNHKSNAVGEVVITLSTGTGLFSSCPVSNRLILQGTGKVVYEMNEPICSNVTSICTNSNETQTSSIRTNKIKELVREIEKINYFSFKDNYEEMGGPSEGGGGGGTITVFIAGKEKTVKRGYAPHAPHELSDLEKKISEAYYGSLRWRISTMP